MTTALGIAAVTAVLGDVIRSGLKAREVGDIVGGGEVPVTAVPPDRITVGGDGKEVPMVNLFLYQATHNVGWRNSGLPVRDSRGARVANQPLALDLHYMLTAYGAEALQAEILLGHAMQLLHDTAVIPRAAIRKALAPPAPPPGFPAALKESALAEQVEQIKVTPQPLTIDEMSKIWSAVNAHYRPTTAYLVTVVLIEGQRSTQASMPVLERRIGTRQLRQPTITRVISDLGDREPLTPASTLVIEGVALTADDVGVRIGSVDVTPAIGSATETRIDVSLASAVLLGVRAGPQFVQIVHNRRLGEPPTRRPLTESNAETFVLRPEIEASVTRNEADGKDNGVDVRKGDIELTLAPAVTAAQRIVALLNQVDAPVDAIPRAYSFPAPTGNGIPAANAESEVVVVPFRRVVPGSYLVRARVDGAESILVTDDDGNFAIPKVVI